MEDTNIKQMNRILNKLFPRLRVQDKTAVVSLLGEKDPFRLIIDTLIQKNKQTDQLDTKLLEFIKEVEGCCLNKLFDRKDFLMIFFEIYVKGQLIPNRFDDSSLKNYGIIMDKYKKHNSMNIFVNKILAEFKKHMSEEEIANVVERFKAEPHYIELQRKLKPPRIIQVYHQERTKEDILKQQQEAIKKIQQPTNQLKSYLAVVSDIKSIVSSNKKFKDQTQINQFRQKICQLINTSYLLKNRKQAALKLQPILNICFKIKYSNSFFTTKKVNNLSQNQFMKFILYAEFVEKVNLVRKDQMTTQDFFNFAMQLTKKEQYCVYWLDCYDQFIYSILLKFDKTKTLFQKHLRQFAPILNHPMTTKIHITLLTMLLQVQCNKTQQDLKGILQLSINQKMNLTDQINIKNNQKTTYQVLFLLAGMNEQVMKKILGKKQIFQKLTLRLYKFDLYSFEDKFKQPLKISEELENKLISIMKDDEEHCQQLIHDHNNKMYVTITNDQFSCKYTYNNQQKRGHVRYHGEVPNKKVFWSYIDINSWKRYLLAEQESDMFDWKRKNDKFYIITHKEVTSRLYVDFESMVVKDIQSEDVTITKIKNTKEILGFMTWLPKYKQKNDLNIGVGQDFMENEQQQANQQVVTLDLETQTFRNMAIFQSYLQPPSQDYETYDNDIKCSNQQLKKYFNNFRDKYIYKRLQKSLNSLKPKIIIKQDKQKKQLPSFLITLNEIPPIIRKLHEKLKQTNLKLKDKMEIFKSEDQTQIKITNAKNQEFVNLYLNYCYMEIKNQLQQTNTYIQLTEKQAESIKALNFNSANMTMHKLKDNLYSIKINPKIFNKTIVMPIEKPIEITIKEVKILKYMFEQVPQYIQQFQKQLKQINQNQFLFRGKFEKYIQLNEKIQQQKQKLQIQELNQQISIVIEDQAQHYKYYQRQLSKIGDVKISRALDDIYLTYPKFKEKQVKQSFQKIKHQIKKNKIDLIKNSTQQVIIRNLPLQIIFPLVQKLSKYHKQLSINQTLHSFVHLKLSYTENQYIIQLNNAHQKNRIAFTNGLENFFKRIKQYQELKKKIQSNNYLVRRYMKPLQQAQIKNYMVKQSFFKLKQMYKNQLQKIFDQIRNKYIQLLTVEFLKYIEKNQDNFFSYFNYQISKKLEQQFKVKKNQKSIKVFQKFFNEYLIENTQIMLKKSELVLNQNKTKYQEVIKNHLLNKFKELDNQLDKGKFNVEQFIYLNESFNILIKTFFGMKLPIIEHLKQFQQKINKNSILIVSTGTGSGKSSVLPIFLVGIGYKKVIVTQPRRLPCQQISKRVENLYGSNAVGYKISGQSKGENNRLVYMTDGLLKQQLYSKKGYQRLNQIDVLILDQIHERSKSLDLILLQLSNYMTQNKKLKIILCSATVDSSIIKMFNKLKYDSFQVKINRFPISQRKIQNISILDQAAELSGRLKNTEQLLVFFPGVSQVLQAVDSFKLTKNKLAYPLYGQQSTFDQQTYIKQGQIFFSTSISETSLTFPNLKYVIDSRKSRIMKFDPRIQVMVTEEVNSSQSSIKQRKGRLGRTCQGEYYYEQYVNTGQDKLLDYDITELQKIDLTNPLFELMMKYDDINVAKQKLKSLKQKNLDYFQERVNYAKKVFQQFNMLQNGRISREIYLKLIKYGNIGSFRHNYALLLAEQKNCIGNMISIVSFAMIGANISQKLLQQIPKNEYKPSGDIETISCFLFKLSRKLNLTKISKEQIGSELMRVQGSLYSKKWRPTLVRILKQMKKFYQIVGDNIMFTDDWSLVQKIMVSKLYRNCLYFNKFMLGGNKKLYEKIKSQFIYKQAHRISQFQYFYQIANSLCYILLKTKKNINAFYLCSVIQIPMENVDLVLTLQLILVQFRNKLSSKCKGKQEIHHRLIRDYLLQ